MVAEALGTVQGILLLILWLLAFGVIVFALADALRQRTEAFPAAGKLTKPIWLAILAVATAIGVIRFANPLDIFMVIAFVAAAVYLADVRPAVRGSTGHGGGGPYGGW